MVNSGDKRSLKNDYCILSTQMRARVLDSDAKMGAIQDTDRAEQATR